MTKEEIIQMANQANLPYDYVGGELMWLDKLEHFAKLIAQKEREACAKIAENRILHDENKNIKKGYFFAQQSIAQDIKTRGQE